MTKSGPAYYDLPAAADGRDNFESVAKYLQQKWKGKIVSKLDGPSTRTWGFKIRGSLVMLKHHDVIGNYFECKKKANGLVKAIVNDITAKLKA